MTVLPPHNYLGPAPLTSKKTKKTIKRSHKPNRKRTRLIDKNLIAEDIERMAHLRSIKYEI